MTLLIDIQPCSNLSEPASRVFKEAGAPRQIRSIRMPFDPFEGQVCDITGWDADSDSPGPAYIMKVEDSGDAFAYLVYGGSGGLRIKPADSGEAWDVSSPRQHGAPYFVVDSDCST